MSLLPNDATYGEQITDCFLFHARGGLQLSPLDVDLLVAWQQLGIPAEVVCRGIKAAAEQRQRNERPDNAALRSLRACERAVLKEFDQHRELSAGRGGQP